MLVGEQTTEGTVVERDPDSPLHLVGGGLFLRTEDGRMLRLIAGRVSESAPADYLHRVSRWRYARYLGQKVRVVGHPMFWTIWCAEIVDTT